MIKVVSFKICPFVQRVTAALEAKQIPYEIEFINLSDKPQWFLDISPNGQVPLLVTESGTALFESDAIIEYIEDEYGALEQGISNEQRALDRAWSYLGSKHYLVQCSTMRSGDEALFSERLNNLQKAFAKVRSSWLIVRILRERSSAMSILLGCLFCIVRISFSSTAVLICWMASLRYKHGNKHYLILG